MELRNKLISYVLHKSFIGNKQQGLDFSHSLVGYSQANKIYGQTNEKYGYPVLETVCHYFTNTKCDLLADVNSKLIDNDLKGLLISEEHLQFSPFMDHGPFKDSFYNIDDEFKSNKEYRSGIYIKISRKVSMETRLIGHFLLPYDKITEIKIDYQDHVIERAEKVFNRWEDITEGKEKTWRKLRSLLIFLNKHKLVAQIEESYNEESTNSEKSFQSDGDDAFKKSSESDIDDTSTIMEDLTIGASAKSAIDTTDSKNEGVEEYAMITVDPVNRDYVICSEDSTQSIAMSMKASTNEDPDYDLKNSLVMEDLGQIARDALANILDNLSPMNQHDYIGLACKLQITKKKVTLLRLYHGGGGCPAYHFLSNLFITSASTPVSELIDVLANEEHFPEDSVDLLQSFTSFKDIPETIKSDLAVSLTQLDPIQVSDWKVLADKFGYTTTEISGFENAIHRYLGYSPTIELFKMIDTERPRLKLTELSEYLGHINNYLAKNELDKRITDKIKNGKKKRGSRK